MFKDGNYASTTFTAEYDKSLENIKNPETGRFIKYGAIIVLVIITGVGYLLIRKKSKFPKHN